MTDFDRSSIFRFSGSGIRTMIRIGLKSESVCPCPDICRYATFHPNQCTRFLSNLAQRQTDKLEVHSVERIYLRQRCFDASKRCVAASTGAQYQYVGFSRRNKIPRCSAYDLKPRVASMTGTQYAFSRRNKISRCSAYAMGESNPVPASGLRSRSGSKVNQFVDVPTSVDKQHFIQIHPRVFE